MRKNKFLIIVLFAMATGGPSLASLKQKLEDLSKQIFEIDLKIQDFKRQGKDRGDLQEAKC